MESKILVVGSINMDLVLKVKHLPQKGETLLGQTIQYIPGGKGANQAVASARLGGKVSFLGKVGSDSFGTQLKQFIDQEKININGLKAGLSSSGLALISVNDQGENTIVVIPGSNAEVTKKDLDDHLSLFQKTDVVVTQLEIPLPTVSSALKLAKNLHKITILNTAPAQNLPSNIFQNTDYLILNETELSFYAKSPQTLTKTNDIVTAAQAIQTKGVRNIIVTLGKKGSLTVSHSEIIRTPGCPVKVIDTTAAGDCFVGAFAVQIAQGISLHSALLYANKAASLSVQRMGASTSLPYAKDLVL